jgi:hypothetical protein
MSKNLFDVNDDVNFIDRPGNLWGKLIKMTKNDSKFAVSYVCRGIMWLGMFASIVLFVTGYIYALIRNFGLFTAQSEKSTNGVSASTTVKSNEVSFADVSVTKLLQLLEKLFIIPMPMIIFAGFFVYFQKVIDPRMTDGAIEGDVDIHSKYYISLSKSLFLSTLISVIFIKLIETSIRILDNTFIGGSPHDWLLFVIVLVTICLLFYYYGILERSIHSFIKFPDHKARDNG